MALNPRVLQVALLPRHRRGRIHPRLLPLRQVQAVSSVLSLDFTLALPGPFLVFFLTGYDSAH